MPKIRHVYVVAFSIAFVLVGCSDSASKNNPKNSVSNNATNNSTNNVTNNTSGLSCEAAVDAYKAAYDDFPRTCDTAADCAWFDGIASCDCPGFGEAGADPQPIYDAQGALATACEGSTDGEIGHRDATCLNSRFCDYNPGGDGGDPSDLSVLACQDGVCAAVEASVTGATITPNTIATSDTGMTDEFFTVIIETEGFAEIDPDVTRLWLSPGAVEATIVTAEELDGTLTLTVAYTWASGLDAGDYDLVAEVGSAEASIERGGLATLTVTN